MPYQTFDDQLGDSKSSEKWDALGLPDITGARVLDIGCNEGYFCFRSLKSGAQSAIGIDKNQKVIDDASKRFPQIDFRAQTWENLPDGPFDLVFMLSALHYEKDPKDLLDRIYQRLSPQGLLVLEIGIVPGQKEALWKTIKRSKGSVDFPSAMMVKDVLLSKYAYKMAGRSVMQSGDPCPRFVFHCRRMQPTVLLIGGKSGAGKTTLAKMLKNQKDISVFSLDKLIVDLSRQGPKAFRNAISKENVPEKLQIAFREIERSGLTEDFIGEIVKLLPRKGLIVVEGAHLDFIHKKLTATLIDSGFVIWNASRAL